SAFPAEISNGEARSISSKKADASSASVSKRMVGVEVISSALFHLIESRVAECLSDFWNTRAVDHEIAARVPFPKLLESFIVNKYLRCSRGIGPVLKVVDAAVQQ